MRENDPDKVLLKQVTARLDEGVEHLDPIIQARLRENRQRAVALAGEKHSWFFAVPRWVTASGLATAAVITVALSFWWSAPKPPTVTEKPVDEIEVMTAQGRLEMYQDLDFYRWLADSRGNH